ncbi:hypothetical protein A9Q83_13365 [Alphaproteobacteria bacterium 46_93_T64]|nr:hypothetical protein A9Q83_13365 [Alphaproteobacteria bacterium 46_93_T64]
MGEFVVRVLAVLALLLVVALGLFFFLYDDTIPPPVTRDEAPDGKVITKAEQSQPKVLQTTKDPEPTMTSNETVTASAPETKVTNAPIIVEKKLKPAKKIETGIVAMKDPSFDVVRVDKNCGLLVAGRAEPTSEVTVYANGKDIGSTFTSSRGEWVFVTTEPLSSGAQEINVKAINPDNREVETARMVIMQVPDCNKDVKERAPALAVLTPKVEGKKTELSKRVTRLLQMPEPVGNVAKAKDLSVASIDYDNQGNVALSGRGTPGNDVQVYLKNKHVGGAPVDEKGDWSLIPKKEIAPGNYNLRVDQLDDKGDVISRVEIPFQRASAEDVILAKGGLEIRAIVQPGNSLWRIARRMYGEGMQYTLIYQANESQIKNPDLIFPGQIFTLPSKKFDKLN